MIEKKNIDTIIEKYDVPTHSDDLAQRIIQASRDIAQKKSFTQKVRHFFTPFQTTQALPYGFASLVIIGILTASVMTNTTQQIEETSSSSDYMMTELFDDDESLLLL